MSLQPSETSYKSAVDKLLVLEKKGYIRRSLNKHRSIILNNVYIELACEQKGSAW